MKKFILAVCLILTTIILHSQVANYDISNYVNPEYKYRYWTVLPSLSNGFSNYINDYASSSLDTKKEYDYDIDFSLRNSFYSQNNSYKKQSSTSIYTYNHFTHGRENSSFINTTNNSFSIKLD